ncbi:c-type cytochrome [Afifella marina]|uniref:Cytochrome c, mono-and diheme variants n=1 Tax=Afifella marina DSM 2698 TaxID=1120955 RepID=A0A1G5P6J2_AFIMA|nr:c-type cytochrome [Afifella marina]MBK1624826.1 cytochrome C [Afifella marina DSM 2698]MBK1628420.1 cytochrome C [Afifella marina]MBK5917907.1 cytochrome C [Afifella marina]RAI18752.1 cytochrome C [Afifella marina DSM 2698]SCZ45155.1 Cytochrome c, mono-and diheme variants [Afifella marina DSM 2698]
MKNPRKFAKTLSIGVAIVVVAGLVGFLVLTSPVTWSLTHPERDVADAGPADLKNGRTLFLAGDCATCHASPRQDDPLLLGGGRELDTEFGLFHMPNISSDPEHGIGGWTLAEFTRAMREGVGPGGILPDGQNLYPAFPYTSYQRMSANDVRDLFAYIKSLKPVASDVPDHELKFPFNIRRGVGVWRLVFLDGKASAPTSTKALKVAKNEADPMKPVVIDASPEAIRARGQYLVEGPGHCAECHSPRTFMGNIPDDLRYGGGPTPEGNGYFPNISPDETGIGFWSVNSTANYLLTGISPINKRAGGDMEEVIANTSQMSAADRYAMAVYLKSIKPVDRPAPGQPEPNHTSQVVMLPEAKAKEIVFPTSSENAVEEANTVYVMHTKSFFLDPANVGAAETSAEGSEDGKFLGGTELHVLGHDGDKVQVALEGWQMEGADSVVYAQKGQRIMQAVLADSAIEALDKGESVVDPDTEQTWTKVSLKGWTEVDGVLVDQPEMWQFTSNLFNSTCAACHTLPEPSHFLANQWIGTLGAMKRFTSLAPDEYRLLLAYLQNHAKDTAAAEEAH